MRIIPVEDLGNTPARVNRKTGEIFLNMSIWRQIPEKERKFILLHEEGHYKLNTSNEIKADSYAFSRYAGSEKYSLKGILHAISDNLDIYHNPEHAKRYYTIVKKLLEFDWKKNGNTKAKQILETMEKQEQIQNLPQQTQALLKQMLVDFLKTKQIKSINSLSEKEKQALLQEFFNQPHVLYLLERTAQNLESYDGKKKSVFDKVIGGAVTAVGAAFGIPVSPEVGSNISAAVRSGITSIFAKKKSTPTKSAPKTDYDTQAWRKALGTSTEEAYKNYLAQYPAGKYAAQAIAKLNSFDDKEWQAAAAANKIEAYEYYLSKRPNGIHATEAKQKIAELKKKRTFMYAGAGAFGIVAIIIVVIVLKR